MDAKRSNNQLELAFPVPGRGEAPSRAGREAEAPMAERETQSPAAATEHLMEEVCEPANLKKALAQVVSNQGGPGVDGMSVEELGPWVEEHRAELLTQLLEGTYKPKPVKRVEIPKPEGGVRKLGLPTVVDRFVQQAVMQVPQERWDPSFSQYSYGFRPQRQAHQAVAQAQQYVAAGLRWVVDIDLEQFLDRASYCPHVNEVI